jgi:glycopeptide antibiotics resistance protein
MKNYVLKAGLAVVMVIYILVLLKLILFKYLTFQDISNHFTFNVEGSGNFDNNFIPFKTIIYYLFLADTNMSIRIDNMLGNIILFTPFGFLIALFSGKLMNFKAVSIATFCLSLFLELTQLIFKFGSFDVDDLILNTLGGLVGFIPIYLYLFLKSKKDDQLTLNY